MRAISSLLIGAVLGVAAVLLHALFPPLGAAIAILGSATGIWSIGRHWGKRSLKIIAAVMWLGVVTKASTPSVSEEFLVMRNTAGELLLNVGLAAIIVAIAFEA